jgi:hypothetical protein
MRGFFFVFSTTPGLRRRIAETQPERPARFPQPQSTVLPLGVVQRLPQGAADLTIRDGPTDVNAESPEMDQIELERLEEMEERLEEMMGINTRMTAMFSGQRDTGELLDLLSESIGIQQEMLCWMVQI